MRYLYIGKTNAKGFRTAIKIGISKDSNKRWKDINRSVSGSVEWPIFSGRVLCSKVRSVVTSKVFAVQGKIQRKREN